MEGSIFIKGSPVTGRFSWCIAPLGILFALLGLVLTAGGLYLWILDGSGFYGASGIALAAVGWGLLRRRAWAFWLAWGLLAAAAVWSWAEVRMEFWPWVPRIIAFLVVALVATLSGPALTRADGGPAVRCKTAAALSGLLAAGLTAMFVGMFFPHPEVTAAGDAPNIIRAQAGQDSGNDWPAWGRNLHGDRFAQFDQINRGNVGELQVAWQMRTGELAVDGGEYQVTPIKVDDSLYLCTPHNVVIALDPVTGNERWRFDPQLREGPITKGWKRCRGVAYTELPPLTATPSLTTTPRGDVSSSDDPDRQAAEPVMAMIQEGAQNASCQQRIISTTGDARLFALDAHSGRLCQGFGEQGFVNLLQGLGENAWEFYNVTSAPLVADGVILVGGRIQDNLQSDVPSGVVRGFDVRSGALLWAWDPARGAADSRPLPEGETYAMDSPNFWGTAAYDAQLGLAYFPTGNQTPDFWTGNRHPYSDEYNDAIVAVDIKTGQERWHFRTAHIDQFDYDVSSQPILYDLPRADGSHTPVLIQLTKRGQIFVLDRRTGEPVFPVEERAVPTDAMPGMKVAPTQPYSALSIGTEPLTETDMWGMSIFDQLYCRIQFKQMRWQGEFTPLSDQQRTLIYPGYYGGMNWGGGALDARSGTLIVNDIRMAQWGQFIKREEAKRINLTPSAEGEYSEQLGTPWGVERSMFVSPLGIPCFKPPFGSMTAIDLSTGKTRWQVPLGSIEDSPVLGVKPRVHLPLGMPTMGGPLVTAGGLTFFHGSMDFYLRALDNATGAELWRSRLPVGGQGAPMTYIGRDGKQYVVVVVGGATRTGSNEERGDYVIAYAL